MASNSFRCHGWVSNTLAVILLLALASSQATGETNCADVVSPISGKRVIDLLYEAIDRGATKEQLYRAVKPSRCESTFRTIIDHYFKKEIPHG